MNVTDLRAVCKLAGIRGVSGKRRSVLESALAEHHARLRIQRWFRRILGRGESCPVSLEPVRYPCFGFRTASRVFIYYNLGVLKQYLVESGSFADPMTREEYSVETLKQMDAVDKYARSLASARGRAVETQFVSVYACSRKRGVYARQRQVRNEVLHRERVVDVLCQEMLRHLSDPATAPVSMGMAFSYVQGYVQNVMFVRDRDREHSVYLSQKVLAAFLGAIESIVPGKARVFEYIVDELHAVNTSLVA